MPNCYVRTVALNLKYGLIVLEIVIEVQKYI